MSHDECLTQLLSLSHHLGNPAYDYAILGEGNTSARATESTFFVKGSGHCLETLTPDGVSEVRFDTVLALLEAEDISDANIKRVLSEARVSSQAPHPSVETILHALLLELPGVNFVGHTHPTAINAIMCARNPELAFVGRLFPDEVVCCGAKYVWIPWTDPGAPLARKVYAEVHAFLAAEGYAPKIIFMQNHGLIALGATVQAVQSATAMIVKTARVILGSLALGGPNPLPAEAIDRIFTRPDELYRAQMLEARTGEDDSHV